MPYFAAARRKRQGGSPARTSVRACDRRGHHCGYAQSNNHQISLLGLPYRLLQDRFSRRPVRLERVVNNSNDGFIPHESKILGCDRDVVPFPAFVSINYIDRGNVRVPARAAASTFGSDSSSPEDPHVAQPENSQPQGHQRWQINKEDAQIGTFRLPLSVTADQGMAYRVASRGSSGRWNLRGRVELHRARSVVEEVMGRASDLRPRNRPTLRPATWLSVVVGVGHR